MKICIISHSAVHQRQQFFYEELSKYADILVFAPKKWKNLKTESYAFERGKLRYELRIKSVENEGNIKEFRINFDMREIFRWKPDIIYCQDEWWTKEAQDCLFTAQVLGHKFILFCWENKEFPTMSHQDLLKRCDWIIAGNKDASTIVSKFNDRITILPQVGVNTKLFRQMKLKKEFKVLSVGRNAKEKGKDLIKESYPETKFIHSEEYDKLPEIYNKAEIHITLPFENEYWKEQSMGYVTAEAMACGLPCITTDCGAIPEYLENSAVHILKNPTEIEVKKIINYLLDHPHERYARGESNKGFIEKNYSNEIIAKKLIEVFKNVIRIP